MLKKARTLLFIAPVRRRTLFAAILASALFSNAADAALSCRDPLSLSQERVLEVLGDLEAQVTALMASSGPTRPNQNRLLESSQLIEAMIARALDGQLPGVSELERAESAVESLRSQGSAPPPAAAADSAPDRSWAALAGRLAEIRPEERYEAVFPTGATLGVIVSEEVAANVFRSRDANLQRAIAKAHRALARGYTSGTNSGIRRFSSNSDIFEIAFAGDGGQLRLAGYVHENALHLVHWSFSGNHGSPTHERTLVEKVLRERNRRGHNLRWQRWAEAPDGGRLSPEGIHLIQLARTLTTPRSIRSVEVNAWSEASG